VECWQPESAPVDTLRAWTERVSYLYVVLDQFEEYFLYHPPGDQQGLDAGLVSLLTARDLRVHVLLSLREDCLSLLDRFKGKVPDLWDNSLRIGHLDLASAEEAVRGPVAAYRDLHGDNARPADIERGLIDELLASPDLRAHREMATDGGPALVPADGVPRIETSYLQLVLRRLWQDAVDRGEPVLRRARLDALHGPKAIVRQHLDEAMRELSTAEADVAIDVLRFLVTPSKTKIALMAEDLAALTPHTANEVNAVLEKLATGSNRILRRVLPPYVPVHGDSAGPPARYEIFHDVLAEPILTWRGERAAERELRREREEAAEKVKEAHEDASRARKRALASLAIAGLALVLLALAAAGWWRADRAEDKASSQQLGSAGLTSLPLDPDASVRLALRGLARQRTPEAEEALRTALPASRLRGILPVKSFGLKADFGANGRLATGDSGGFLRVWDWGARRELVRLHEADWVEDVSLADRGDLLLDLSHWHASLWRVGDCLNGRACRPVWKPDDEDLTAARLSPDGTTVALANTDTVTLYDVQACASGGACRPERREVLHTSEGTVGLAFGETTDTLATIDSRAVSVWQRRNGRFRREHRVSGPWGQPRVVAISARSGLLAAAGDMRARVWDLRRCRPTCSVVGTADLPDWVNDVEFNPQGTRLVLADEDGNARVWDRRISEPVAVLRGHPGTIFAATFDPTGTTVATAGADGTIRLWDATTGQVIAESSSWINGATFTRDAKAIVVGASDGTVRLFDSSGDRRPLATMLVTVGAAATRDERRRAKVAGTYLFSGATSARAAMVDVAEPSPNGRWIFTGDEDGYLERWDVGECRKMVVCPTYAGTELGDDNVNPARNPVWAVSASADNRLVAAGYAYDGGVKLFDVGGKELAALSRDAIHGETLAVGFLGRGRRLITTSSNGDAIVWDVSGCARGRCKPRAVRTLRQTEPIYDVASSADGSRIVTGSGDRVARIWSLTGPKTAAVELHGHSSNVRAVAFDRSGTRVATAGDDKTTRVWDAETGRVLGVMEMHSAQVSSVDFDPRDPSLILSASTDGSARMYRCTVCRPLSELRQMAEAEQRRVHRSARLLRSP
jgi:WD40 repeat protein